MSFIKDVSRREMEFSLMMSTLEVGPRIIAVNRIPNMKYQIEMEKYPLDLEQYLEEDGQLKDVEREIDALIDKIHDLGLIHGDLHFRNVVLNPQTDEVRLIDFAHMQYFDEVNLEKISVFWGFDQILPSIKEVKAFEYSMYRG